jgi:hypothetical protein
LWNTLLVSSLWIPSNDTLNPNIPVEPFPVILSTSTQKNRFCSYVKQGKFSEIILNVDSLLAEDVDANLNVIDSAALRDTLSAFITRLKTQCNVSRVLVWVTSYKDEQATKDTTDDMDIIRRAASFNQTYTGKFDGLYIDYEYWEKRYGYNPSDTNSLAFPDYKYADTGYVQCKRLMNAATNYHFVPANHFTYIQLYLNDLARVADTFSTHSWLTDTLQAMTFDTLFYIANTETFMAHIFHRAKCKLQLAFYINDLTSPGDCGVGISKAPVRFIHTSSYNKNGKRLALFGLDNRTTFIIPQFSYEDSVGTAKGKDNNYLGDWKNAGNGDPLDCYHDSLHYFYQVDSIFNDQFLNSSVVPIDGWGTISIAGSSGFKYDKRSIDTLLTLDTVLFSINNCIGGTRIGK